MVNRIISQGMIFGVELDRYVWAERERWAIRGFFTGALITNVIWLIIVSW